MQMLNLDENSGTLQGCDRFWDDGDEIVVQLRPAKPADHVAIAPNYVPEGEMLGRVSKAALLDAARTILGLQ